MGSRTTIVRKNIAEHIKELREEMDANQYVFADTLGVSRGSISMYESENRTADVEFAYTVCRRFGVSADWLIGLSSVKRPDTTMQAICDKTGLTHEAVEKLSTAASAGRKHDYRTYHTDFVSKMVMLQAFDRLIDKIHDITRLQKEVFDLHNGKIHSPEVPLSEKMEQYRPFAEKLRELYGEHAQVLSGEDYVDYAINSAKALAGELVSELINEKEIRAALDEADEVLQRRIREAEREE